jgi:hypothetical protein
MIDSGKTVIVPPPHSLTIHTPALLNFTSFLYTEIPIISIDGRDPVDNPDRYGKRRIFQGSGILFNELFIDKHG